MIRTGNNSETLYSSARFVVENHPDVNATEIIKGRSRKSGEPTKVSNVVFTGTDAILFLGGFDKAVTELSKDQVDEEYLNEFSPLMKLQTIQ